MAVILVVEDNRDNRDALAGVLAAIGHDIVTADSGEDALRLLDHRGDVELVLCDIRLPGMDGIAFRAAARQRRPDVRIAFMTGDAQAVDDAIAEGAIAILKPYNFNILTQVIADQLTRPREA